MDNVGRTKSSSQASFSSDMDLHTSHNGLVDKRKRSFSNERWRNGNKILQNNVNMEWNMKETFSHIEHPLVEVWADRRTPQTSLTCQLSLHLQPVFHCVLTHMKLALHAHGSRHQRKHRFVKSQYTVLLMKYTTHRWH